MTSLPSLRRFLPVLCLPVLVAGFGCGREEPEPTRVDRYEMTGRVVSVQPSAGGLARVSIDHDPVPEFRDLSSGEVLGMPAMKMSFPLAEGLVVPNEGDAVAFTLVVDGIDRAGLPYVVEAIEPMSEDASGAQAEGDAEAAETP